MMKRYFVINHNYFASELAIVNPCWDDERLFREARKMNIAFYQHMIAYEWLAQLAGKTLQKAKLWNRTPPL